MIEDRSYSKIACSVTHYFGKAVKETLSYTKTKLFQKLQVNRSSTTVGEKKKNHFDCTIKLVRLLSAQLLSKKAWDLTSLEQMNLLHQSLNSHFIIKALDQDDVRELAVLSLH